MSMDFWEHFKPVDRSFWLRQRIRRVKLTQAKAVIGLKNLITAWNLRQVILRNKKEANVYKETDSIRLKT